MNKTSKELDLSSIITQVSKDDDINRSIPLTGTVITSVTSPTTKSISSTKYQIIILSCFFSARSNRKRRLMSILLCCLSVSNRNRPKSAIYSPKNEAPINEVNKTNSF
jgi:hypothetical protein